MIERDKRAFICQIILRRSHIFRQTLLLLQMTQGQSLTMACHEFSLLQPIQIEHISQEALGKISCR